jgi:hypothetical protein
MTQGSGMKDTIRLEPNLALATPMREERDTLESFGRRVRMNETAARRVHDLANRTRPRERFDTVETRKSRFDDRQKTVYQNDNKPSMSVERAEKLMKKLSTVASSPSEETDTPKTSKQETGKIHLFQVRCGRQRSQSSLLSNM